MSKLYSVWVSGEPSRCLSAYHDDTEALTSFRRLVLSIREDIAAGNLEPGCADALTLFCHGYFDDDDGHVRGVAIPLKLADALSITPEIDIPPEDDCEVIE